MRIWMVLATIAVLLVPGCLSGLTKDKEVVPDEWPTDAIRLQPGSQLYFVDGDQASQCTAGFLFASRDNETLYLSVSAHCLMQRGNGADVYDRVPGFSTKPVGRVAYDGWQDHEGDINWDFALVAISNREGVRENTSPAVKQWGGPTGLADATFAVPGQRVAAYGAAGARGADHPDNARLGRFFLNDGNELNVRLDVPAVAGDSGGPLMTWDGQAFGLLHGIFAVTGPVAGARLDVYTPLDVNVDRARGEIPGLRLVTWNAFDGPTLPV